MIAATDPQEFIPGGRQQAFQHPGPVESNDNLDHFSGDDLLLDRFERVSIGTIKSSERWSIRKVKTPFDNNQPIRTCNVNYESKSYIPTNNSVSNKDMLFEDCGSQNSAENNISSVTSKHVSDVAAKQSRSNRMSMEADTNTKTMSDSSKTISVSANIKFKPDVDYMEEELYIKDKIVIWSKGLDYNLNSSHRTTIFSHSSSNSIIDAIWCIFYVERPEFNKNALNYIDEPLGKPLECICIVDTQNVRVYSTTNEDFITTLPFQVKKLWSVKFGILLEKSCSGSTFDTSPTIFSLSHPLDEVNPVAFVRNGSVNLVEDNNLQIVFTSGKPSLCMIYNSLNNLHSIYKIRRIRKSEFHDDHTEPESTAMHSTKFKSYYSNADPVCKGGLYSGYSVLSHMSKTSNITPIGSKNPIPGQSRPQTPITLSNQSTPWLKRLSRLPGSLRGNTKYFDMSMENFTADDCKKYKMSKPSFGLELLWSENPNTLREGLLNGPAQKVFFTSDYSGQDYLCYHIPLRSQVYVLKTEYTQNSMIFGSLSSINARDAIDIPRLRMIAIVDLTGNVVLYSGLTVIGKLHIGGVLAQYLPSPKTFTANYKLFNSPFPRRSSLLPHCATPSAEGHFDEHLLSPVLPRKSSNPVLQFPFNSDSYNIRNESTKVTLCGLLDSIEDKITLQYSDGSFYRVALPNVVSSPLVENCINVLKHILKREALMTVLPRWYAIRNAPGVSDLTLNHEWDMFTNLLFELIGFNTCTDQLNDVNNDLISTPLCAAKRQRPSSAGTDSDWNFLMQSTQHNKSFNSLKKILHLEKGKETPAKEKYFIDFKSKGVLFCYVRIIHFTLHLLYEDLKLNTLRKEDLLLLAMFLSKLAKILKLKLYVLHYWKDFPLECSYSTKDKKCPDLSATISWNIIVEKPWSLLEFLYDLFRGEEVGSFPFINYVNNRTRDVIQLCGTYLIDIVNVEKLIHFVTPPGIKTKPFTPIKLNPALTKDTPAHKVVLLMVSMGINTRDLETFPIGVNFLLHEALFSCRENPPTDWPSDAYHLLHRSDLASQALIIELKKSVVPSKTIYTMFSQVNEVLPVINQVVDGDQEDGMEEIDGSLLKLRFSEDLRVAETRRLLQSAKPVPILLVQRPDVSDHDFIEEQEKHLYAICTRTMSLPVGRGMFTLRTATPVITEPLPVPPLCLSGKAPPRGTTVELTHIDSPPNMNLWPLFHNGVANGLRIDPDARNIDSNWITFNKPKSNVEIQMEHAGFLLALGLNGHLTNLDSPNTFEYLSKFHEMTSLGVLLGLSANLRGTSDVQMTKILSLHVEALLPPTSMELDVPQNLQVAGLFGVGLVYQGTSHRHMTEILLTEIGRPPGPEMENSIDRESYSLAAGLALGLVTLRQGGKTSSLSDLNVPNTLHYYMVGGNKRPVIGSQKEKYKVPSFQIREGSTVNLDVTAPGATLALGLMYLGSNNKAIADWMAPPDTQYLLDFVRPDFLMLRTLSRALILWNDVRPEKEWIETQVPDTIRPYCIVKPTILLEVDYEAMNQAYCNIIAGACFAMGLKYAGSADEVAFQTLLEYCHMFTSLTSKSIAELAGKPTIETCLNIVLLSASMVMAGTGNLEIMRIVRYLRRRVGFASSAVVTYGSHLAIHMALGLLFLGGGRYTLSNSPASVAALICAFYPKFPTHSNDNRYHLQAFRHLYVLAVEARLFIPKDITTGRMCYANINVIRLDGLSINLRGPGLIPDLNTLYKVSIKDDRYWPVVFERERNWDQLLKLLSSCCCIDVRQRAGCLSYTEDKLGFKSELARTLRHCSDLPWDPLAKKIVSFTSDCIIRYFTDHFLNVNETKNTPTFNESKLKQDLTRVAYDCVVKDKLPILPLLASIIKIVHDLQNPISTIELWHFKLVCALVLKNSRSTSVLINSELILSFHQQALMLIDNWEPQLRSELKTYILGEELECSYRFLKNFANYIVFYTIPYNFSSNNKKLLEIMYRLNKINCNSETIDKVLRILGFVR